MTIFTGGVSVSGVTFSFLQLINEMTNSKTEAILIKLLYLFIPVISKLSDLNTFKKSSAKIH
jgi:hypothetical protein